MNRTLLPTILICTISATTLGLSQASAGERPPNNAKPLAEIAKSLEDKGYSPITEISMDNGDWEVEAYKDGQARELKVNPVTANIISDRSDDHDDDDD